MNQMNPDQNHMIHKDPWLAANTQKDAWIFLNTEIDQFV